jgi:hypothetical protein
LSAVWTLALRCSRSSCYCWWSICICSGATIASSTNSRLSQHLVNERILQPQLQFLKMVLQNTFIDQKNVLRAEAWFGNSDVNRSLSTNWAALCHMSLVNSGDKWFPTLQSVDDLVDGFLWSWFVTNYCDAKKSSLVLVHFYINHLQCTWSSGIIEDTIDGADFH